MGSYHGNVVLEVFARNPECNRRNHSSFLVDLVALVGGLEEFGSGADDSFGVPDHQETGGFQGVMEDRDHSPLKNWTHVNEYVATAHQIHV
ncbi:MAG TPA: hypothetical protein VM912_07780 [Terriglobales bacterium]|nr:hypothetical protein [Terriglobales bacterium]